jgi:glutaredoxin
MVWVGADAPSRRSFSLPSVDRQRLRLRAGSMLGTLGLAGSARHSGSCRHATLSVEEMMKGDNDHGADAVLLGDDAAKRPLKPRTPTLTPPNEPEVINAWELMAGLEDDEPTPRAPYKNLLLDEPPHEFVLEAPPLPQWMQADMDIPVALDFDPEVLSGFREALEGTTPSPEPAVVSSAEDETPREQEPQNRKGADACDMPMSPPSPEPAVVSSAEDETPTREQERKDRKDADACDMPMSPPSPEPAAVVVSSAEDKTPREQERKDRKDADACVMPMSPATGDMPPELSGLVRARIIAFQERIERRRTKGRDAKLSPLWPPGGERKAVVYFTSLRGVRKTFVDCCAVRSILRSYGVRLDERDVSMHAVFKAELADLLGPGFAGAALPRVFIDGQYLGGAEDVHFLHEAGELGRALEGCEAAPSRKLGYMEACAACGDVRFVPCETCYGSCKIFVEDDDADDRYHDVGEFRRCSDCNENGLVRCPVCCC